MRDKQSQRQNYSHARKTQTQTTQKKHSKLNTLQHRTDKQNNKAKQTKNAKEETIQRRKEQREQAQIHGEKAYKLLALQRNLSTNKAKELIDNGLVHVNGKRLDIARQILPFNTRFHILDSQNIVVFENDDFFVLDKGVGIESYSLEKIYPNYKLINRLDRDTSGVILMAKNEAAKQQAVQEFKQRRVEKIYYALVEGILSDELEIHKKILTNKDTHAKSQISPLGQEAITRVKPLQILGKTTLVEIAIITGRTHQIRIHLANMKYPIIGDVIYNKTSHAKSTRLMLHCQKTALLGHEFISKRDIEREFRRE